MLPFGELEGAIMDVLWAADRPLLVREVLEELQKRRPLAYTTVLTVMEILRRKGLLERAKDGRANRYWPVMSREEYTARLMGEVLATSSNRTATLTRFFSQLSAEEAEQLRRALDEAKAREPES